MRWESHGFSCHWSEPPKEARKPQLYPAVFTFTSRGKWWLPGNFSMAQLCAACSMRITGYSVEQCRGKLFTITNWDFRVLAKNFECKIQEVKKIKIKYIYTLFFKWALLIILLSIQEILIVFLLFHFINMFCLSLLKLLSFLPQSFIESAFVFVF